MILKLFEMSDKMKKETQILALAIAVVCVLATAVFAVVGQVSRAQSPNTIPARSWPYKVEPFIEPRLNAIAQRVNIKKWPTTDILRGAPEINKSLLTKPGLITRENISYGAGPFADETGVGGVGEWSWNRLVKNTKPLPTDLPAERKENLLAHLSPKLRNDPNFVEEYLRRKLERYRKSKIYRVVGSMRVSVCLAPNSVAANEYLIYVKGWSSLPTEAIVWAFLESKRLEGLGTIGFLSPPNVMFVRDNIAVVIDARGELASEAVPLARKIDSLIKKQPVLTYQQLLARKPSITIAERVENTEVAGQKTVSYKVSSPEGQKIVNVRAYVDGKATGLKDGKVRIAGKKEGKVKVRLTATTSELVSNTVESEVIIDE